jgi:hypothetical protein
VSRPRNVVNCQRLAAPAGLALDQPVELRHRALIVHVEESGLERLALGLGQAGRLQAALAQERLEARRDHAGQRFGVLRQVLGAGARHEPRDDLHAVRRERVAVGDVGERREEGAVPGGETRLGHAENVFLMVMKCQRVPLPGTSISTRKH